MIFKNSRYVKTGAYWSRNNETLLIKLRSRPKFNLKNVSHYTWVQADTIDGVAFRLYGNAQLWWAIMDANPQFITEMDISPGNVLAIPDYREVVKLCG